jgi:anti-anti-sigma factor
MYTLETDVACTPCVVRLGGELTIYHATELRQALLPLFLQHRALDIDLAAVTEIDTAGVQVLMVSKRESLKAMCELHLTRCSEPVSSVLDAFGLKEDCGSSAMRGSGLDNMGAQN